jgi:hypothetical protein
MADRKLTTAVQPNQSQSTGSPRRSPRVLRAAGAAALLVVLSVFGAAPASADTTCGDSCLVGTTVATPVGPATITVSPTNVVTVSLAPATPTLVIGIAFTIPPGPPCRTFCARTTVESAGGTVDIDTVVIPPGQPSRFTVPSLAVISIHPPGPCRVRTVGTTVTFTPIT